VALKGSPGVSNNTPKDSLMKTLIQHAHRILIPSASNVDMEAKPFHGSAMSVECQRLFTEENFGASKPIGGTQARFHNVGRDYSVDEVPSIVEGLIAEFGHKVRLGLPLEALLCQQQNAHFIPEWYAVFGKSFNDRWIYWVDDRFLITPEGHGKNWSSCHTIFLVEEL